MPFDKEVLAILKNKVTPTSGEVLVFLREHYPKSFQKSTLIAKTGLTIYVGKTAIERLEAADLIEPDDPTNRLVLYRISENGIKMLELIEGNEI
jgi:DNA-binding MarR family transcriptional regulator